MGRWKEREKVRDPSHVKMEKMENSADDTNFTRFLQMPFIVQPLWLDVQRADPERRSYRSKNEMLARRYAGPAISKPLSNDNASSFGHLQGHYVEKKI